MKQYNNYTADDFTFVVCAYQECEYLEEAHPFRKGADDFRKDPDLDLHAE